MKLRIIPILLISILLVSSAAAGPIGLSSRETVRSSTQNSAVITGPLRVHASNSRYFADGSGKAVLLTGSHTWSNFRDRGTEDPPAPFGFDSYLNFLEKHGHNFIRLWTWELPKFKCGNEAKIVIPFPWPRTGPGIASDGKPKFDLSRFDQSYFDRLRSRVLKARGRGIYVSVMLFEGYGLQFCRLPQDGFPFAGENNVNGINTGGICSHTLADRKVTAIQEAYVKKVIDTLNDLDNVLYEISNEGPAIPENTEWQYYMINFIHKYQLKKPKKHPVWMSWQCNPARNNDVLFESPAEAISPGWGGNWRSPEDDYRNNPPISDGRKVVISDTDHLWGIGGDHVWVWKSFLRGLNPIFMDPYKPEKDQGYLELIRQNMGYTLLYARKITLASMVPRNDSSSTNYCLANPGSEYLIYIPSSGHRGMGRLDRLDLHRWVNKFTRLLGWNESVEIDLSGSPETFRVEWFNPRTGEAVDGGVVKGGGRKSLTAPFTGDAVLYIYKP